MERDLGCSGTQAKGRKGGALLAEEGRGRDPWSDQVDLEETSGEAQSDGRGSSVGRGSAFLVFARLCPSGCLGGLKSLLPVVGSLETQCICDREVSACASCYPIKGGVLLRHGVSRRVCSEYLT